MKYGFLIGILVLLTGCGERVWNNPYPASEAQANTVYSSFSERPKHLDPARSYSANEYALIANIYEPPLQYHFLKRPYELVPLAADGMPQVTFLDANRQPLPETAPPESIKYSQYTVRIRPGVRYQPHPAFARHVAGDYRYHNLDDDALSRLHALADFEHTDSREVTAADYVYQIKRLAHPRLHSPILGLMSEYIVGLGDYAKMLEGQLPDETGVGVGSEFFELTKKPLEGAEVVDPHTYRILVHGKYPQLVYWLAMPFFAPMPEEADRFYNQSGMQARNITLDWFPVGSGPYMLSINNPNRMMVLERNPNFHEEFYPSEGELGDVANGLLADAGKKLPFVDRVVSSLEKETIPYWNKFLQGYYDSSGVGSDSFDQALQVSGGGEFELTEAMKQKGIQLRTSVETSVFYLGFNMLDPVIGGLNESARKLRQAIALAVDYEEYVSIFLNGRGFPAQGPIPPGIFGFEENERGINEIVYDWVGGAAKRKSLGRAKQLLAEAGYPEGREAISGKPLLLHFDVTGTGPDQKARMDWFRKQFAKIGLQLNVRNTDYNRFREKMRKGTAQIYQWGWNADYPDSENFLFLLYGPNGKVEYDGENASNYHNPEYDRRFEKMKHMENGPERLALIREMQEIARNDSPWLWGINPMSVSLHHGWYANTKPNLMANNTLKYKRLDPAKRRELQEAWNSPVAWPLGLIAAFLILILIPAAWTYWRRDHVTPARPLAQNGQR